MGIKDRIAEFNTSIPSTVKLIAVSKFYSAEAILEAYDAGHRRFGESRMQEVEEKYKTLPLDIEWHFIGHLQRNKVKSIIPYIHTIHSVDSLRLFEEIVKQSTELKRKVCCLIQVHIADEETKFGFSEKECIELIESEIWQESEYAYIGGIMGMATNTDDDVQVRIEFRRLGQLFELLKTKYFSNTDSFKEVSMGMSNDYKLAIEEGSTMIRVGSSIFGNREY